MKGANVDIPLFLLLIGIVLAILVNGPVGLACIAAGLIWMIYNKVFGSKT